MRKKKDLVKTKIYPFTKPEYSKLKNVLLQRMDPSEEYFDFENGRYVNNLIYFDPYTKTNYVRRVSTLKTNSYVKVRYPVFDKNNNIKFDKNGDVIFEYKDYAIDDSFGVRITPQVMDAKIDTYLKYLDRTGFQATFDSFVAHVGIISPRWMGDLLYDSESAHPCNVDIITRQKLAYVRALFENSILSDEGQTRAVFRYKSTMQKMEKYEQEKIRLDEKIFDRNFKMTEEKFKFTKELHEKTIEDGKVNITIQADL